MSAYWLAASIVLVYWAGLLIGSAWPINIRAEWAGLGLVLAVAGAVIVSVAS